MSILLDNSLKKVVADATYLKLDGTNSPTANISWGDFDITDVDKLVLIDDGEVGTSTNKWVFDDTLGAISTLSAVGINKANPRDEFDVNGVANAETLRATGSTVPDSSAGVEIQFFSNDGHVFSFNRGTSQYRPLFISGDPLYLREGSSTVVTIDGGIVTTSGDLVATGNLLVNGGDIGITADTDLLQLADSLLTLNGNLLVEGGDIGITADTNLMQLAANSLTVNGDMGIGKTPDSGAKLQIKDAGGTIELERTSNNTSGPTFDFWKNRNGDGTAGIDDDFIGIQRWLFNNSLGVQTVGAQFFSQVLEVDDGVEEANLRYSILKAGTLRQVLNLTPDETVFNEGGVDINSRFETTNIANAFLIDAGANTASFGVPLTISGNLDMDGNNILNVDTLYVTTIIGGSPLTLQATQLTIEGLETKASMFIDGDLFRIETVLGSLVFDAGKDFNFTAGESAEFKSVQYTFLNDNDYSMLNMNTTEICIGNNDVDILFEHVGAGDTVIFESDPANDIVQVGKDIATTFVVNSDAFYIDKITDWAGFGIVPESIIHASSVGTQVRINTETNNDLGDLPKAMVGFEVLGASVWQMGLDGLTTNPKPDQFFLRYNNSDANKFLTVDTDGLISMGNIGTDIVEIEGDGDVNFVGGAGLQFGEVCYHDSGTNLVMAAQDTWYQFLGFNANCETNGDVIPDHTNDHITVGKAGRYLVTINASVRSATGTDFEMNAFKNDGASAILVADVHFTTSAGGKGVPISISGIAVLAANDTVEVWSQRTTGGVASKTLIFDSCILTVVQLGGTG